MLADLQARVTFEADSSGDIQVPQGGKGGTVPQTTRHVNDLTKSRVVLWTVIIPLADSMVPSSKAPGPVWTLLLGQDRGWILHSPWFIVDRSKACGSSAAYTFDLMLEAHGLKSILAPSFR